MLGTSAMTPTAERNHPGVYVQYEGLGMLLDAGEGVQRQLRKAGINQSKIRAILLTHWHADHALGLLGVLQSLMIHHVHDEVLLITPHGGEKRLRSLFRAFSARPDYPLRVVEAPSDADGSFPFHGLTIRTRPVEHAQPTLAFRIDEPGRWKVHAERLRMAGIRPGPCLKALQEGRDAECNGKHLAVREYASFQPGRSLVYATDYASPRQIVSFARDATVLISEATYDERLAVKAAEHAHVTARQAALLAREASAGLLVLTHFSQRYESTSVLVEEARSVFPNTIAADDFMRITLTNPLGIGRCEKE